MTQDLNSCGFFEIFDVKVPGNCTEDKLFLLWDDTGSPKRVPGQPVCEPAVGRPCPQRRTLRNVCGGSDATGTRGRTGSPPPKSSALAADAERDRSALSWVGAVFNLALLRHQDDSWKPQYPGPVVMGFCWVGNLSAFSRPIVRRKMRGQRQGKLTIGSSSAESLSRIVNFFFYCSWKISD